METFLVGGAVRDEMLGIPTKDMDFVCIAESFDAMRNELIAEGFKIHTENPEFVTIRCGIPEGNDLRQWSKDADFVLARKDSASSDGRRPDFVEPGTLFDDLSRRDFTVNAMARSVDGTLIDPFDGATDLENKVLRFVGNPWDRIREDGLRVLRGFRFGITKGFQFDTVTAIVLVSDLAAEMLMCVSVERIREELERMFAFDTLETLNFMASLPENLQQAIFRDGLRLAPTLKC